MKYRIHKKDELNWEIMEWQAGGQIISRGRYAGQAMKEGWRPLGSYHGRLEHAAVALLEIATKAALPTGEGLDTETILEAIDSAKEAVLAAVEAVTPAEFAKKSTKGRKPKKTT